MPTTKTRKKQREAPSPDTVLEILDSILAKWMESGQLFAATNLDQVDKQASGVVLFGAFWCETCQRHRMRQPEGKMICPVCSDLTTELDTRILSGDGSKTIPIIGVVNVTPHQLPIDVPEAE